MGDYIGSRALCIMTIVFNFCCQFPFVYQVYIEFDISLSLSVWYNHTAYCLSATIIVVYMRNVNLITIRSSTGIAEKYDKLYMYTALK